MQTSKARETIENAKCAAQEFVVAETLLIQNSLPKPFFQNIKTLAMQDAD